MKQQDNKQSLVFGWYWTLFNTERQITNAACTGLIFKMAGDIAHKNVIAKSSVFECLLVSIINTMFSVKTIKTTAGITYHCDCVPEQHNSGIAARVNSRILPGCDCTAFKRIDCALSYQPPIYTLAFSYEKNNMVYALVYKRTESTCMSWSFSSHN